MDKYKALKGMLYNTSLLKKLTLAYGVCILIPVLLVGSYTYSRYQQSVSDEVVKTAQQRLEQIKEGILSKVNFVENTGNNILFTNVIMEFFGRRYIFSAYTLEQYNHYIIPFLTSMATLSYPVVQKMRIYVANDSIPEYGELVLRDDELKGFEWYNSFLKQDIEAIWLYNHQRDFKSEYDVTNSPTFTLVKKLKTVMGRYVGVIILDVPQKEMFSAVAMAAGDEKALFITESSGSVIYSSLVSIDGLETVIRQNVSGEKGSFVQQGYLYGYDFVEPLGIKLVSRASLANLMRPFRNTVRNILLASIAGLIVLIYLTYLILRLIWKRIRNIVGVMNVVAEGNFQVRIPIEGKDEAGQLARDFNILIGKIDELVRDVLRKETSQKDAQLTALQYQINPHFIYNTFDIFRARLEIDGNYDVADAIGKFGRILRYNLNGNSKYATIAEEVSHIRSYIDLQQIRYGSRIVLDVLLPEYLGQIKILKFLLQPVVENSIKYGMLKRQQEMTINVSFKKNGNTLTICIEDNGAGMNSSQLYKLNSGFEKPGIAENNNQQNGSIGLANISERIKIYYGSPYHMRMESELGKYTRTFIVVACGENEGGDGYVQNTGS